MVKLDLTDAYLTVPVSPECQEFLQFEWDGILYKFTSLAFGLKSAPWVFTKLLKPLLSFFRKRGVRMVAYLDDFLVINASREA